MSLATEKAAAAKAEKADAIVNFRPAYIAMLCLGMFTSAFVSINNISAGRRVSTPSRRNSRPIG